MRRAFLAIVVSLILINLASFGFAEPTEVDLDLSVLPASVAYAQVVAMQREPDAYAGQTLRIAGVFNYSQARQHGVIIIADSTGCCETSLDFICTGSPVYPEDFPELYSSFLLIGRFEPCENGSGTYLLADAVIESPHANR